MKLVAMVTAMGNGIEVDVEKVHALQRQTDDNTILHVPSGVIIVSTPPYELIRSLMTRSVRP